MEDINLDACFQYFEMMLANGLAVGEKKGYPYIIVFWDIINNNGVIEPIYKQAYVRDLNDVFRLVKMKELDINKVTVFDVTTGVEVDKNIFKKEN